MPRNPIQWTCTIATTLVILLIFIGGLVRATGAGLGCPDWPRCWGSWWPPESAEAIKLENLNPAKIPAEFRDAPDPRVYFNKDKMWIEYLNRLFGVLSGFGVIAMVVATMGKIRQRPGLFALSFLTLSVMAVQGWLGALVVRSGLKQNMITIHMAMALIILALLVFTTFLAYGSRRLAAGVAEPIRRRLSLLAGLALTCTLLQVLGGTHVREMLDHVADTRPDIARADWIHQLGWFDHFHRAFSWAVFFSSLSLLVLVRRHVPAMRRRAAGAFGLVIAQIMLGISLAYFGLPPISQFLHLGIAATLAALLFRLVLDTTGGENPARADSSSGQPIS